MIPLASPSHGGLNPVWLTSIDAGYAADATAAPLRAITAERSGGSARRHHRARATIWYLLRRLDWGGRRARWASCRTPLISPVSPASRRLIEARRAGRHGGNAARPW